MKSAKVKTAERIGLEKVEKRIAIAVTSDSSVKMRNTGFRRFGSAPGASHPALYQACSVIDQ